MNKNIAFAAVGLAGALVIGGTAFSASASIPDSSGTIHACYGSGGSLKVIDSSVTLTCPRGYRKLNWNQTGPAGPPGPGLTWTATTGSSPQLLQHGTYLVDVEVGLINPPAAQPSGSCIIGPDVATSQSGDVVIGYSGTYPPLPLPSGVPTTFSFSGMMTFVSGTSPASLDVVCEDANQGGPEIASLQFWVTPITTS